VLLVVLVFVMVGACYAEENISIYSWSYWKERDLHFMEAIYLMREEN